MCVRSGDVLFRGFDDALGGCPTTFVNSESSPELSGVVMVSTTRSRSICQFEMDLVVSFWVGVNSVSVWCGSYAFGLAVYGT